MAVIAISRQVAALGDEVATELAKKLGYRFFGRKEIESKIIELGFPKEKMEKYDERKPGFFSSLVRDRDEYLDYLQTVVLEAATTGDCILIGRGSFAILENIPNVLSVRFVANDSIRIERLMKEFDWDEKQAIKRIEESATNRHGFHKSFFNITEEDPVHFDMVLNTGVFNQETAADMLCKMTRLLITEEREVAGAKKIENMLEGQKLANILIYEKKLNINFLRVVIEEDKVILHGISDSTVVVEKAVSFVKEIVNTKEVETLISVVKDFKAYP